MPRTIAIVDADAAFRSRCADAVAGGANEAFELDSGEAAIELCRSRHVACLLIGEQLADGPGLGLLDRLAGLKRFPEVPVVFVLAAPDVHQEADARYGGAQECVHRGDVSEPLFRRLIDTAIERHHLRLALQAAEDKFRALLDLSTEPITITRFSDDRFVEVNSPFERLTGFSRDEALGQRPVDLGLWADPRQHDEGLHFIEEERTLRDLDAEFVTKTGRHVRGSISATRITLDGEPCTLSFVRIKDPPSRRKK